MEKRSAKGLGGAGWGTGLVCHILQHWCFIFLYIINVFLVDSRVPLNKPLPGFWDGLSSCVTMANKIGQGLLSCPEATWHHSTQVHMAKSLHSRTREDVSELSGAKLIGIFKNHSMAHFVSLTLQMLTWQRLVCEGKHPLIHVYH